MTKKFTKMHGAGNDFVIFDARHQPLNLSADQCRLIADRHVGIGCDQVIVIEPSQRAAAYMRIYNSDGSQSNSCGNATRCVAWLLMQESGSRQLVIETGGGLLECLRTGDLHITVDMGEPKLTWNEIPLSEEKETISFLLTTHDLPLITLSCVSMGNPHAVMVVDDVAQTQVARLGSQLEHHTLFPERANIGFAQIISSSHIRLRVWERGSGETLACGTAACAALVALSRRGLLTDTADVDLPGGRLTIRWDKTTNRICMTGPVALSFEGTLAL